MGTVSNQGIAALRQTYRQVSRGLWQWCSQRGALLVLLLLLALALAVSYAFPQTPAHIRSDPTQYKEWLSTIQVRYRNWTSLLEAIGVFEIRDMAWFRVLLALIALIALVSLGNQTGQLIQPLQIKQPASFYDAPDADTLTGTLSVVEATACVQRAIREAGLKTDRETDGDTTFLFGHRARWGAASAVLTQSATLLIAVGLAVNVGWGWEQQDVQLLPGSPVPLGPEGNLSVELQSSSVSLDEALVNLDGQQATVTGERSMCRSSLGCQLTDQSGPLIQVSAQRTDGTRLKVADYAVRPEPLDSLWFTFARAASPQDTDRLFIVPDERLVVRLKWLNQNEQQTPRFQQWVFRQDGQELVGEELIEIQDGESRTEIDGITYSWHVSHYVTVEFDYRPGRLTSGAGIVLLAAGLLGQLIPRRRIWSAVHSRNGHTTVSIRQQRGGLSIRRGRAADDEWSALRAEIEGKQ